MCVMENQAILNGLLGVIQQPVFIKDENFVYTFCNQVFADHLRKTKQEIIGKNVFQLFAPESAEIYHRADQQLFESGGTQQYETMILTIDGKEHHSVIHKNIITDDSGKKTGIIGVIEDISELKKQEKKLDQTEIRYKKIFENIQDIFYQIDLNGIITEISPSVEKYSSYTRKELIGQHIDSLYLNPEDRKIKVKEIEEKGEILDYEVRLKGLNNEIYYTSVNAHLMLDEDGKVVGIEGTLRDLTERKKADEKLKLSVSQLHAALDSTADGILVVDQSGKITNYNKQFKYIFNVPEGILESGDDRAVIETVLNLFRNPEQFISKVQYLYDHAELDSFDVLEFKDGRIIERYSCPQMLEGKPIGRVWSFRDVTDRKKAEEQLNLMAHALKSINECISITDTSDRILFVNEAFEQTYGYSAGELIGENISIVRSTRNDQKIIDQILDLTNESGWKGELLNKRKDGTDFPISLSTTVVENDKGEILGLVGVASDITERKQAEELLRHSEMKYRNLIESMPDGVYRSTPEGKFEEVNPAMVKMLGYDSKEELMAIDIKTQLYFDPKDRESLVLQEELEEMGIFMLKKKDGSGIWVEDHGWYTTDKTGKVVVHEGILRDITDRKMAEIQMHKYSEELQELIATKDKLFSIIAHDLKSPFNSIIGLTELIKNEARHMDLATIEQYAGVIYSTSRNTFRLLENLLDWARLQQSRMPFAPEPVLLKKLVSETIELMIEKANSKMIAIINYIPDGLIVSADEDMLKTVFRNLISNALKFTTATGKVEIAAVQKTNEVEITVKDTGTGIRKEDIEKLFKVDSNYTQRGTENEKGTGLGLVLCRDFVEKHGGKIWVESQEGKGSVFSFTLSHSQSSNK